MSTSPKILIIRLSSLGDILHTLPAFAGLRETFPDARIDWLVAGQFEFLLSAFRVPALRGIDEIHALHPVPPHSRSGNRHSWGWAWNTVRNLRARHYDISIDFQGLLKTAFLGLISGSGTRLGFSGDLVREPPAHRFYHQTLAQPQKEVHVLRLNQMLAGLAGAHSTSAACDFAVGLAGLVGNEKALGETFHITSDEALTWNQIYTEIAGALGIESPEILKIPTDFIVERFPQLLGGLKGDKSNPGVFDNSKIMRFVPGFHCQTSFRTGIHEAVEWFRRHPDQKTIQPQTNALFDQVISAWRG